MPDNICKDHAPRPHNEFICHATGEKRQNIINTLKVLLDKVDDRPCLIQDVRRASKDKPIMKYPGYVDPHHPVYKPQPRELYFCKTAQEKYQENEKICKDDEHQHQTTNKYTHPDCNTKIPAQERPRFKELELRGGELYKECFCVRANGLQDQCDLSDCQGKPECIAVNPGPCCGPALTQLCREQKQKVQQAAKKDIRREEICHEDAHHEANQKHIHCYCYYD